MRALLHPHASIPAPIMFAPRTVLRRTAMILPLVARTAAFAVPRAIAPSLASTTPFSPGPTRSCAPFTAAAHVRPMGVRMMADTAAAKTSFAVDAPPAPGQPFHLAFPVRDIEEAREFYGGTLGLTQGRIAPGKWVDYSLNGHQIVCHWAGNDYKCVDYYNPVDGDEVPVPHFGLALEEEQWHALAAKVRDAGIKFIVEPHLRFKGMPGEQWTMFFKDPSGNNLEFKAMTNPENLFARYDVVD
uniref:VOC domain-containing protein n=1 Tax=Hemiselmis tepida TaxID=464990 RepID=A0A7S0W350_9CRYP